MFLPGRGILFALEFLVMTLFFFFCPMPSLPVIAIYSVCFALYHFVNAHSVCVTYSGSMPFVCAITVFVVLCGSYAPLSLPFKS